MPAHLLVNGRSIVEESWCRAVTSHHIALARHGLLIAEGALSESYLENANRHLFEPGVIATLFPDLRSDARDGRYDARACFPVLHHGEALERLRGTLMARAAAPRAWLVRPRSMLRATRSRIRDPAPRSGRRSRSAG